jgi:hypothetical protein
LLTWITAISSSLISLFCSSSWPLHKAARNPPMGLLFSKEKMKSALTFCLCSQIALVFLGSWIHQTALAFVFYYSGPVSHTDACITSSSKSNDSLSARPSPVSAFNSANLHPSAFTIPFFLWKKNSSHSDRQSNLVFILFLSAFTTVYFVRTESIISYLIDSIHSS